MACLWDRQAPLGPAFETGKRPSFHVTGGKWLHRNFHTRRYTFTHIYVYTYTYIYIYGPPCERRVQLLISKEICFRSVNSSWIYLQQLFVIEWRILSNYFLYVTLFQSTPELWIISFTNDSDWLDTNYIVRFVKVCVYIIYQSNRIFNFKYKIDTVMSLPSRNAHILRWSSKQK